MPYLPLALTVAVSELLFRLLGRTRLRVRAPTPLEWHPGVSILIPERGSAQMLQSCLEHLDGALSRVGEPTEVIVVVNGSPLVDYEALRASHPDVRWLHFAQPLGFTRAVLHGLAAARHGAVYLLNNDMLLEPDALAALLRWRAPQVFALASQIFFQDVTRRREETGWTSMPIEDGLPRPRHDVPSGSTVRGTVWAGAGSAMFHAGLLRELLPGSLPFDPFYWEDTDLGVRAWRLGYEVLFCPGSVAWHKHRATVQRFYGAEEIARIFERNRLQFQLRNPFPPQPLPTTLYHVAGVDRTTLAELGSWRGCVQLWRARWRAFRAPCRHVDYAMMPAKRFHRQTTRPRLVVVSPFVVLPPAHGGAVRTQRLAAALADDYEVILLSDELALYGEPAEAHPGPYASVHLVAGRPAEPAGHESDRIARIRSHSHRVIKSELARLVALYRPVAVLVEHMELAGLIDIEPAHRPAFILDLHDVLLRPGEPAQAKADRFESALMRRFDGLIVCSREDQALIEGTSRLIPNGFDFNATRPYVPSRDNRTILFVGPFRAPNNVQGIRDFLEYVYPRVEAAVPGVKVTILGGHGAREIAQRERCFARESIEIVEYVEDTRDLLDACAVSINPQSELRGSSLKIIESLAAGRACVSTRVGARGWLEQGFQGLVVVERVADFVTPLVRLLLDEDHRLALEAPERGKLAAYSWDAAGIALKTYVGEVVSRAARRKVLAAG